MKKKQIIAIGLAVVLGAFLLTGCGKTPAKESGNENSASDIDQGVEDQVDEPEVGDGEIDPSKLEPVELIWNLVGTPQADQDAVFEEVNRVLKEKLNTTVKFNIIDWGSYDEKMKVSIAANEPFDMCFTSDWTNPYTTNAQKGAYYPLGDLLKEYGSNIMEQVPESYWGATEVGGEIYGVINYQITARIKGVSFPEDVIEELGYDVSAITSYADLTDYFATVKEKMPDMVPFLGMSESIDAIQMPALFTEETGFSIDYLQGPLAVRKEDTKKTFNAVESPEFMEFCKMTRDWYENGYVRKDVASINDFKGESKTHSYASFITGAGPGSVQVESANAGFP
jgi:putative aldouronate transport system substrate-binding protein